MRGNMFLRAVLVLAALSAVIMPAGPAALGAVPVYINEPGFEAPVLTDGDWDSHPENFMTGQVWLNGYYVVTSPTVWVVGSAGSGVYNPNTYNGFGGVAPEGDNVGYATSYVGFDGGLSQVLLKRTSTLQADAQYELSVKVGNPVPYNATIGVGPTADYRIELVAGGVVVASNSGPSPVTDSYWTTASLTYHSEAAPAQLGKQLEIRILAKDFTDDFEVDFDSVSLNATYSHPIADPGGLSYIGGYKVYRGGSLTLDGSGSIPSEGSSITSYAWDLNKDGDFTDRTGASPGAISYADLISTYGMTGGDNTISLKVTDASGPAGSSTSTGIVTVFKDKLYWDTNGAPAAGAGASLTGTWGTMNYWNTDDTGAAGGMIQTTATPTANTDDLYLGAGPAADSGNSGGTITVSGAQVAKSLNFQSSGAVIVSGGTSITLGGGTAGSGGITVPQYAFGTTAQGNVSISTPIILNNSQAWTVGSGRTLTVSGAVSGSGKTLTKSGPGILILSSTTNSYSGGTVIDAGVLRFNSATAIAGSGRNVTVKAGATVAAGYAIDNVFLNRIVETSDAFVVALAANSTYVLDFSSSTGANLPNASLGAAANATYSGTLTPNGTTCRLGGGGATLTLNTAGALAAGKNLTVGGNVTISAANSSFNGTVRINAGTLALGNVSALPSSTPITLAGAGAILSLNATGTTISAPITLDGGGTITTPLNVAGNIVTLGQITGTGDLTLQASNGNNTQPTIVLGAASNYGGNTMIRTSANGNMVVKAAPGIPNVLPAGTVLTMESYYNDRYVELDLNGNSQALAGLKCNNTGDYYGLCLIVNSSATPLTLTVNNSTDNFFTGLLGSGGYPSSWTTQPLLKGDNFGLTKTGTGRLTLKPPSPYDINCTNSYTGDTIVSNGILGLAGAVTNNIASSPTIKVAGGAGLDVTGLTDGTIVLGAGQILKGGGTVTGNVTAPLEAKIAPGDSAGTLTVVGNVMMHDESIYEWELGAAAADKVVVTGNLTLESGWKLSLASAGGTPATGSTYDLFTYTGTFTGTILADLISIPAGWPSVAFAQDTMPGAGRIYLDFGKTGDTNSDGVVDAADFITMKKNFGSGAGPVGGLSLPTSDMGPVPQGIPEPGSVMLLMFGAGWLIPRRRS